MTLPISVILAPATTLRGIMIKVFLQLAAIHGVLCAPWSPFSVYGPPPESYSVEKSLPFEKSQPPSFSAFDNLPGTRNLAEHSQLPLNLPGTRNLAEKSIPDSVTLKRIPIPAEDLELPRYPYDGRFLRGELQMEKESSPVEGAPQAEQEYPQENPPQAPGYPNPISEENGSQDQQGYPQEHPPQAPGYPNSTPVEERPQPGQGYPQEHPPQAPGYPNPTPVEERPQPGQGYPQEHPPQAPVYPNPTPEEETGSEIQETEFSPSSNSPQAAIQHPLPTPEQSNSGTDIQSTFIQPASQPEANSGASDHINISPGTSINVQDSHGQYSHGFENPDGTQVQESGHLISTDNGWEFVISKEGSYRYISPEGIPISVRYIADENGFRILSQNFARR